MALRPSAIALAASAVPAILLGYLSVRSLGAALTSLPSDALVQAMRTRDTAPPTPKQLADTARAQATAAGWFERARYSSAALSAIALSPPLQRYRLGGDMGAPALLAGALSAAPAAPFNWVRLAEQRLDAGDKRGAAKAWEMSVLTGRYVPGLMTSRLYVAFRMFPTEDMELLDLLKDQVRVSAEADGRELARAAQFGFADAFVRVVLASDTALVRNFDRGMAYNIAADGAAAWQAINADRARRLRERARAGAAR